MNIRLTTGGEYMATLPVQTLRGMVRASARGKTWIEAATRCRAFAAEMEGAR